MNSPKHSKKAVRRNAENAIVVTAHPLLRPGETLDQFFARRRVLNNEMRMDGYRKELRRRQAQG